MSRHTLVEPEVVLVPLRAIMEEALKNPKVTKSKEDAHRTRGTVMVEVLTGWTAAAALALRYEGITREGVWSPENDFLQKLLPIFFERLVDSEVDIRIESSEIPLKEPVNLNELPEREIETVRWKRTGAADINIDLAKPWVRNIVYLANSRLFEEWNVSHHTTHPRTLIIPSSPIFFTNRLRTYRRLGNLGHSETLNRIFLQMLLYWSMLQHGHDGYGKPLTSEYRHSSRGWVDMIESHSQDFELGYRSFEITRDWWIDNLSILHDASITDAVEYWIPKATGFSKEIIGEKRTFLRRCFQEMVQDLSGLLDATARALVKKSRQTHNSLSHGETPASDPRGNVFFPSAR